jgi:hypothetical protein
MADDQQPGDGTGAAVQPGALSAPPADTELSYTERLLIMVIVALAVLATVLVARTTAVLLWQDNSTAWRVLGSVGYAPRHIGWLDPGTILILSIPLGPLGTLAHEGGHALGGRLAGFWLASVQVGFVKLTRTNTGLRLGLSKKKWWVGGSTSSYPVDELNLRLRYTLFVALGPLTDLLLGFLAAEFAHFALSAAPSNAIAYDTLDLLAIFGFTGFILNIIPLKLWRLRNDGWFLLQLLIGSRSMERAMVFAILRGYTEREVPVGGRSPSVIARAQAIAADRPEAHLAAIYAYSNALALGDAAAAGRLLDQVIATAATPPGPVSTLAHEIAFFEARHRGRPAAARTWLERAHNDRFQSFMRPRAMAAILLAEARYAEARAQAAEALVAREAFAHTSGRQYREEEEDLRAMHEEAGRALESPGST